MRLCLLLVLQKAISHLSFLHSDSSLVVSLRSALSNSCSIESPDCRVMHLVRFQLLVLLSCIWLRSFSKLKIHDLYLEHQF